MPSRSRRRLALLVSAYYLYRRRLRALQLARRAARRPRLPQPPQGARLRRGTRRLRRRRNPLRRAPLVLRSPRAALAACCCDPCADRGRVGISRLARHRGGCGAAPRRQPSSAKPAISCCGSRDRSPSTTSCAAWISRSGSSASRRSRSSRTCSSGRSRRRATCPTPEVRARGRASSFAPRLRHARLLQAPPGQALPLQRRRPRLPRLPDRERRPHRLRRSGRRRRRDPRPAAKARGLRRGARAATRGRSASSEQPQAALRAARPARAVHGRRGDRRHRRVHPRRTRDPEGAPVRVAARKAGFSTELADVTALDDATFAALERVSDALARRQQRAWLRDGTRRAQARRPAGHARPPRTGPGRSRPRLPPLRSQHSAAPRSRSRSCAAIPTSPNGLTEFMVVAADRGAKGPRGRRGLAQLRRIRPAPPQPRRTPPTGRGAGSSAWATSLPDRAPLPLQCEVLPALGAALPDVRRRPRPAACRARLAVARRAAAEADSAPPLEPDAMRAEGRPYAGTRAGTAARGRVLGTSSR